MPRLILAFSLIVIALALTACEDKPSAIPPPKETAGALKAAPVITAPVIMGYGKDWPPQDCRYSFVSDLPPETRICGVMGDGAGEYLDVIINPRNPREKAKLTKVQVNSPDAPVTLLLSSSSSTVWQIESTPGTEVTAAITSGNDSQAVMGLKPDAKTVAAESFGSMRCAPFNSEPRSPRLALVDFSKNNFNRNPDVVTTSVNGNAVCGWPASPGVELISYGDLRPEKYGAYADIQTKLNMAMSAGLIRRAKPIDIKTFQEARSMGGHLLIEKDNSDHLLHDTYVVESQDFIFPNEFELFANNYEKRIYTFLIPPHLRLPDGPIEGLRILFMDDGSCLGQQCGHNQGVYNADGVISTMPAPDLKLPPKCRFDDLKLPENARIYAGGAHSSPQVVGKDPISKYEIGRMDVTVNTPGETVVLILSAYAPVHWYFDLKPGTEVAAVVLGGYHTQKIINLPEGIPVISGSYDEKGCWFFYVPTDTKELRKINHISHNLFGRLPDRGYLADNGRLIIGAPFEAPPKKSSASSTSIDETDLPPIEPPKKKAIASSKWEVTNPDIKDALAKGLIRPASDELKENWIQKNVELAGVANLVDLANFRYLKSNMIYEIMSDEFTLPKDPFGPGAADYYIPENISIPEGHLGHGSLIIYDGTCRNVSFVYCGNYPLEIN